MDLGLISVRYARALLKAGIEAKEAEKVATGISNISVSEAVKAGKVYSIDGKRISKSAKGLVVINGKKVILK